MGLLNLDRQYQAYKDHIQKAINEVLESTQFIMGPQIQELEKALAERIGAKYCIATSSGTDSLLLALKALGIKEGDEVICTPFTWISPIEVICRMGAKPVFVDIDPETYLIDENQIEKAITSKTKAIIPISLYGQMVNFEKINQLASKYNIAVVEDGAQSFGSTQKGKNSGNASTIGATSFFPTKPLGCYGDGGAVFTNDDELAHIMKAMRVHGASERYNHQFVGMNGRMDTLQAAILLAKLPFFDNEIKKREQVAQVYDQELKDYFLTPKVISGNTHVYAQYALQSENRAKIIEELNKNNVPCAVYYPICIHLQPAYKFLGYKEGSMPNAERVSQRVFCVPMNPWIEKEELDNIINILKQSVLQHA